MRASEFIFEAINWQGNLGASQARMTDHTIEEARRYVKENYPKNKTFTVNRLEPGFRALDLKTGSVNQDAARASMSQEAALNQFVKIFKLKENSYMSGSEQVSASVGFSWHVGEDQERKHAIFYYEDRGMGNDTITVAAKKSTDLDIMVETLIQAGIVEDPAAVKAKRAENAAKRNDALEKKGIKLGTRITLNRIDNNELWWSGTVTDIGKTGTVTITIDKIHPNMQAFTIGKTHKMKPSSISKSMISN